MTVALSRNQIDIGERILRSLDKTEDKPTAMFWSETGDHWSLIVAMRTLTDKQTAEEVSKRFHKVLKEITKDDIDFSLLSPFHEIISNNIMTAQTGPDDIASIREEGNRINGRLLPKTYIYRMTMNEQ